RFGCRNSNSINSYANPYQYDQPETSQSNQTPTTLSHQSTFSQHTESKLPNLNTEVTENKETHLKRSISEVASPETDITLQENPFVVPKPTATRKKPKTSKLEETTHSNVSIFGMIYPAKTFINNHEPPFPLNCDQLVLLLESIAGLSNPIILINDYTSDLRSLSDMLKKIRPYLKERSIKKRLTNLNKKILAHLGE
uniref:Uncharacterized protein LOC114349118 n=1 Tax=Diabrotica virgifera virgifera TaxID=50390 RepID=A0A6P7H9K3_DIAVI